MPIVRSLVELMGGTITVESEQGKGSKFTVTLTHKLADQAHCEKTPAGTEEQSDHCLTGKRLLLAKDNDLNAEIATAFLQDMGFTVDRAVDGADCVDRYQHEAAGTYGLILMDIQMPNMDGYQATLAIRGLPDKEKAGIPIVAMTANAFAEDRQKAFNVGMNGHIAKPINTEILRETLRELL
jgi:CheY-like chemotaxis protein